MAESRGAIVTAQCREFCTLVVVHACKEIENYLLVPDAWRRAALRQLQLEADDLFAQSTLKVIDDFFVDQNLTLPPGRTWRQLNANIFGVVNGKRILFENADSLFQQLRSSDPSVALIREAVALSMKPDEIHEDVHEFIGKALLLQRQD